MARIPAKKVEQVNKSSHFTTDINTDSIDFTTDKDKYTFDKECYIGTDKLVKESEVSGGIQATETDMEVATDETKFVSALRFLYGFAYHLENYIFNPLATTAKTIIESINEVHSELGQIPDSYVTYTKVATDLKATIELTGTEINFTTHKGLRKVITGDTTFTVSNLIENKGVNLSLSGNHAVAFTGCTCIGGAYDGAVENFIQLVCARNSSNTLVVYYSFNQPI